MNIIGTIAIFVLSLESSICYPMVYKYSGTNVRQSVNKNMVNRNYNFGSWREKTDRIISTNSVDKVVSKVKSNGELEHIPLAYNNFVSLNDGQQISKIGIGTWAWGDSLFWGYNSSQDGGLQAAFNTSIVNSINLIDTAEIYGNGKSELLIGRFIRKYSKESDTKNLVVATKFAPFPWRVGSQSVVSACQDSLDRLGLSTIGLYQIHFPGVWQNEAYWDGLAECYHRGLVKGVGVSNYGPLQLRRVFETLKSRDVPLLTNQVQYSLLSRAPESNGIMRVAGALNVTILAYSPLAQGILTGKYTSNSVPTGPRSRVIREALPKVSPLLRELNTISKSRGKTVAQVALNWCIQKGTVPIPGARNSAQAFENAGAMGWDLDKEEVSLLDLRSRQCSYSVAGTSFLQGR